MALIEAVLDKRLPASELYRDRLATCTGCMACESQCASGVPVTKIIQTAREQAVRESGTGIIQSLVAGALAHDVLLRSLSWLAPAMLHFERHAVFGASGGHAGFAALEKRSHAAERKRVVFYPGCAIGHFQQDLKDSTITVLDALGFDVVVPEGLKCCGRPFLSVGDRKRARDLAVHNSKILGSIEAAAVVTACASCGLTFKSEYACLLEGSGIRPAQVLDVHEFLAERANGLSLGTLHGRATWHDPCHLGRGQGLAGVARKVLRSVPGLSLVEMEQPDQCCGFGGIMRATHPALARTIGRAKALAIMSTGATIAATGCPGCRMQLADSLAREGAEIEVVHTVQLLAEALRKEDPGMGRGTALQPRASACAQNR